VTAQPNQLFPAFLTSALNLVSSTQADSLILVLDAPVNWPELAQRCNGVATIIASADRSLIEAAAGAGFGTVMIDIPESTVHEQLTQTVLDSVAQEYVRPGSTVVVVYSGFDRDSLDTISLFRLNERLGRLTARDLKRLETKVPLETLKVVVDLAVEIGREGREGKPVGTMFVVGDHRRVLEQSQPAVWDSVKGYPRKDRNLFEARVRESVKEIAQMDGAFIVASDGTVESTCRIIDTAPVEISLSHGLGARHYAAAAISKNTQAIAVVVSESNGTVRIFQNGQIVLRIEPLRRAMKWKDSSELRMET
jgi:DNA integrity scanning protein DisA with diadenylate cyclase activity